MDYVNVGRTGLKISRIVLGCMTFGNPSWAKWVLTEAASRDMMSRALDLGVNAFDIADAYSLGESEVIVGRFLKDARKRHEIVIASKLFYAMGSDPNNRGLSRKHIMEAVDASLQRLQTDYIDLYQIHRFDYETPLEETLDALNDVVRAGKVRYLGASSMHAWQFMRAIGLQRQHGWAPFVSMQNHYNLLYREEEREMLPLCRSEGIGVIPWSPLARGVLAGRRTGQNEKSMRSETDAQQGRLYGEAPDEGILTALETVARRLGRPMAQVAYAWVATRPGVTAPIVGPSRPEHFDDIIAALDIRLSDDDVKVLEAPYRPKAVAGFV